MPLNDVPHELPRPSRGTVPLPPTSLPRDIDNETRTNLFILAMIVLLVLLVLIAIPTVFDWKAKTMTSELNSKIDLVTGALLGIFGDSIRRASSTRTNSKTKED